MYPTLRQLRPLRRVMLTNPRTSQKKIENLIFPVVLSLLQQELKSLYDKLLHLHPRSIFCLEKLCVLPKQSLDLKYYVPICALCMLGTARYFQCTTKKNKPGPINKSTYNEPDSGVSVDQLQSYQPVLVP